MIAFAQQSNIIEFPPSAIGQGNNEWYTPPRYIEAAREVMGSIDLDPASCELANRTVKATTYYDMHTNGLDKPWHGRVWLNPPFSATTNIKLPQFTWGVKLFDEHQKGHVTQSILLLATSHRKWFHRLWEMTQALICISEERIHFYRPNHTHQELREAICFLYLGPLEQKFIDVFSQFGTIAKRVSPPKPTYHPLSLWEEV